MNRQEAQQAIVDAFARQGIDAMLVKGSWALRDKNDKLQWASWSKARKLAGVPVPDSLRRQRRERVLYGDAATIAAISGRM